MNQTGEQKKVMNQTRTTLSYVIYMSLTNFQLLDLAKRMNIPLESP